MSKKNHNRISASPASVAASMGSSELKAEYKIIKHDLVRVVIVNAIFLVGILALYYTNNQSQYLERWFQSLIK